MATDVATRELAIRAPTVPGGQPDVLTLGKLLAQSGYFKDVRDAAQAVAKILAGQEMGFGPIASLTGVFIVKDKITYGANLIAAAIKRSTKYDFRVRKLDGEGCSIEFFEAGQPVGLSEFSMADAKTAELANGNNAHSWRHFPRNMLFARAISNGAKWYCADVFGGIAVYTPDELGATIDGETGLPLAPPPMPLPRPELKAVPSESDEVLDAAVSLMQDAAPEGEVAVEEAITAATLTDRLNKLEYGDSETFAKIKADANTARPTFNSVELKELRALIERTAAEKGLG